MATIHIFILTVALHGPGEAPTAAPTPRFTHGPVLGRLESDGVGVWARTSRPGAFRVRYGISPDRLEASTAPVTTPLERDNTGWVRLRGLKSNTRYHYRLEIPGDPPASGPGGSFRTLPRREDFHHPDLNPRGLFNFSFEFACGNSPRGSRAGSPVRPAFVTMNRELRGKIDFAILDGDFIYERKRDFPVDRWLEQAGAARDSLPRLVALAPSIVGIWENYKDYYETDPHLVDWHRDVPTFFVFDDHEILNDINATGEIGHRDRKTVFRDIGITAWDHYLGWSRAPAFRQGIHLGVAELAAGSDVLRDRSARFSRLDREQAANLHVHWGGPEAGTPGRSDRVGPGDPNAGVYEIVEILDDQRLRIRPAARESRRSIYSIGRLTFSRQRISNCEFYYLDTRSERGLHDVKNPGKPGLSMLGRKQKKWLIDSMRRSDAEFFFVVSSVNFMIPHVGGTSRGPSRVSNKDEAWTSFLEEREELIDFWDRLGRPVFVLTGDLHNSFAIRVTDRVWEFASGPHSSGNHPVDSEGGRPANGPFRHGPRPCEIRWSSYVLPDVPVRARHLPHYCVVQVNNVFRNPGSAGADRWVAFPRPHVIFRYHDGLTGNLAYAEPIFAAAPAETRSRRAGEGEGK